MRRKIDADTAAKAGDLVYIEHGYTWYEGVILSNDGGIILARMKYVGNDTKVECVSYTKHSASIARCRPRYLIEPTL